MQSQAGSSGDEGSAPCGGEVSDAWSELSHVCADPPPMRALCAHCRRPAVACWCGALPAQALRPRGRVVLLQHPAERRRALHTARVLELALAPGRLLLYRGKRFPQPAHDADAALPPLRRLLAAPRAILLYPAPHARDLRELASELRDDEDYDLMIVDGTWPQAKAMVASSAALRGLRAAKLPPMPEVASDYVIRTQPARGCLSTLEAAADALALLERAPHYGVVLRAPLRALCDHQLRCGAVPHHDAEHKRASRRLARALDSTT